MFTSVATDYCVFLCEHGAALQSIWTLINAGSPLSLSEAIAAAKSKPKLWGKIPRIIPFDENERLTFVTDSASKSRMKDVDGFDIVDEYEEQYLRAHSIQTLTVNNGGY